MRLNDMKAMLDSEDKNLYVKDIISVIISKFKHFHRNEAHTPMHMWDDYVDLYKRAVNLSQVQVLDVPVEPVAPKNDVKPAAKLQAQGSPGKSDQTKSEVKACDVSKLQAPVDGADKSRHAVSSDDLQT